MKNINEQISALFKKAAESALSGSANTTSCIIFYQPKAPNDLKKFSKIDNDK